MANQNSNTQTSFLRDLLARFNIHLPALPTTPPSHQPERDTLLQLAVLIGVAVIFHFSIADLAIACFALIIYVIKLLLLVGKNKRTAPPQILIILMTVFSIGLIILFYGGWNGQRAGISFLVLLVSLKFLESRTLRDYYITCLISYFLAASSFLFNSSLINIFFVIIYALAITGIMLKLSSPSALSWKTTLSSASGIISRALPLALILFFFFPRIHGNFGFFPMQDDNELNNALSNDLVAGDIATAAFNNRLAFRVEFDGPIPSNNKLYWRSKVMPIEENFTWRVRPPTPNDIVNAKDKESYLADIATSTSSQQQLTNYTVLSEPSADIFLPYLDYVVNFSRGRFLDDFSVWQRRGRSSSFSYSGSALLQNSIIEPNQVNTQILLETSNQPTARTQALLTTWRQQANNPIELAQQVLNHFTNNEFYYSLYPPSLELQPVDEFLFNTKTGYCEHYASAFTTLMRWLGVPARVVAGYQGGLANQSGQYLEVRYSDAHAWSEILVDQQWVRVDPTAAISPERIEYGMDAFMSLWDSSGLSGSNGDISLSNYLNPTGMDRYYRQLRDGWNNIGYQWNKWVVNYDSDTQKELLANLGFNGPNRYGTLVIIMFSSLAAILLFYFWRLIPNKIKRSKSQNLYMKFVAKFNNTDVIKNLSDSPNEFAQKAIDQFPQQKQKILELTNTYVQLRYGKSSNDIDKNSDELNKFKQLVKQFRLNT